MKKIGILALVAILVAALATCGRRNKDNTEPTTTATEPSTTVTEPITTVPTIIDPTIIDPTIAPNVPDPGVDDDHLVDPTDGADARGWMS